MPKPETHLYALAAVLMYPFFRIILVLLLDRIGLCRQDLELCREVSFTSSSAKEDRLVPSFDVL